MPTKCIHLSMAPQGREKRSLRTGPPYLCCQMLLSDDISSINLDLRAKGAHGAVPKTTGRKRFKNSQTVQSTDVCSVVLRPRTRGLNLSNQFQCVLNVHTCVQWCEYVVLLYPIKNPDPRYDLSYGFLVWWFFTNLLFIPKRLLFFL